tara:strand:- start:314 stop:1129 length:816 start_codon:yes stop_codon:yes gene_type:complete
MKGIVYWCEVCSIQKEGTSIRLDSDSYKTNTYKKNFGCKTLDAWKNHIKSHKHIKSVATINCYKDEFIFECKHCSEKMDERSYKLHEERNKLLWYSKNYDWAQQSSCNNFIWNSKRYENINILREIVNSSKIYITKEERKKKLFAKAFELVNNQEEYDKQIDIARQAAKEKAKSLFEEKKQKQMEREQAHLNKNKNKEPIVKNIQMVIEDEEDEVEEVELKKDDLNIPPIFDDDDACSNCGLYQNFLVEYKQEKLDRYSIKICDCTDSESE